jgi:hypothetical protein
VDIGSRRCARARSQAKRYQQGWTGLYDFRPVFRNSSAMAYAIAYSIHTLEMSALRGWGVAFLGYRGDRGPGNRYSPFASHHCDGAWAHRHLCECSGR